MISVVLLLWCSYGGLTRPWVQPLLVGIRSIHLRAQNSACINIDLGDTVPVLQLLPVEGEQSDSADATADGQAQLLSTAAAAGRLEEVTELLGAGVGADAWRSLLHTAICSDSSDSPDRCAAGTLWDALRCIVPAGTGTSRWPRRCWQQMPPSTQSTAMVALH